MYVVFHFYPQKDSCGRDLPDTDTIVVKLEKITSVEPSWLTDDDGQSHACSVVHLSDGNSIQVIETVQTFITGIANARKKMKGAWDINDVGFIFLE